ncbi:MAG: HAD family hydrolase [Candidatus Bathyarchaeota archaeon]|nr:MAG: HAD family hydrolase [Candidatus Bathyarchaeota archaeon]
MARVAVISFDLDGTLVDYGFVNSVWFEGIPRLYSLEKKVSFDDALSAVKREYDKVGKERPEWYDVHYWLRKFNLNVAPRELLRSFQDRIEIYPEVPRVLDELNKRGFRLVIVTNARTEFVELELGKSKMKNCFERVFSSTSDFGLVKKTVTLYQKICDILKVAPQEMIHIGDDQNFDFEVPRRLGILAFYLDRSGKHEGELTMHSLEEFSEKLRWL